MKYVHYYETDSEFRQVYNGNEYEEPWVSLTEQNGEVNYNKIMPIGYIDSSNLFGQLALGFDYNNDGQLNENDFNYWQYYCEDPERVKPDLNLDKLSVSQVDNYLLTEVCCEQITGNELYAWDDGWDMPAQIVRLANDNGQERWCIYNVGVHFSEGERMVSEPDYFAIYDRKPELSNIAGYQMAA